MKCQHCKKDFEECEIQEHHIHPRFMDNKKGNGMKIYLCKKCHTILHLKIPALYWNILTEEQKKKVIDIIIKATKKYGDSYDS